MSGMIAVLPFTVYSLKMNLESAASSSRNALHCL